MAFTEEQKQKQRDRHAAWKKARKEGKMKEYQANKKKEQDKADNKRKQTLKDRHKLWKTDRKEYNKQKKAHITKSETKRYESAASRQEAFNKKNKRGKYSKGHEKKQEELYGKNLTGVRKTLSKFNPFKKESVKKDNLKIKTENEKKKKRKDKTISSRVTAAMNR